MKTITLKIPIKQGSLVFCYGQPTPFLDIFLHKTTYFSTANQEYEGLLPALLQELHRPVREVDHLHEDDGEQWSFSAARPTRALCGNRYHGEARPIERHVDVSVDRVRCSGFNVGEVKQRPSRR